ncbi:MAG: type II toxin-antitoxin system RnlB family antitoxin [Halanaerobiales bacterium]|nr:type II toxin-antitoxin system RnlB family antitoxin [Halanaerobiales bacterium]
MNNYEIKRVNYENFSFIVFSQTYETPFSCLKEISKELLSYNAVKCKIVFDMLLNMGNTSERFVEAYFNGDEFEKTSFKCININKKNQLRRISCNYYKENKEMLEYSILNSAQKKMLSRGISI